MGASALNNGSGSLARVCVWRERGRNGGAGGEEIQRQSCQRRTKKEIEDKRRRPEGEVEKETLV